MISYAVPKRIAYLVFIGELYSVTRASGSDRESDNWGYDTTIPQP